jgi:glycosyltransferase involved in cell wall biosynthesis
MGNIPFSVAMSVYKNDNPEYLKVALDSICEQSYLPDEVFLVEDGPLSKELEDIIDCYSNKYPFFTVWKEKENGGLGNALKIAVCNCRNEIILRMDSDDISAPGRFERQIEEYQKEPVDVLGGWTLGFFDSIENGDVSAFRPSLTDKDIKAGFSHSSQISHVTVLMRKSAVLNAGNYLDLFYHEDYYLWVRMINAGCTFRNIPAYLVYVRCGYEQAARHGGRKYFSAEKILRRYMLKNSICSRSSYIKEMAIRFVYQLIFTKNMRVFADKKLKRKILNREEVNSIISTPLI